MTKEELKKEFEKYLKDSADYYDPREPFTDRKLLQLWLDCAEPREKRIADLENKLANVSYQLEGREVELKELQEKFDKRLKRHCNTIRSLVDELERKQNAEKKLQEENEGLRIDVQNRLNVEVENIELKKQIEKMKCCENCTHNVAILYCCHDCVNWSNWELRSKEND